MRADLLSFSGESYAERTNYLEINSPPTPVGYSPPDASNLRNFQRLVLRGFEVCDVFANSDHNLLKCDNAGAIALGPDVQRMYMTRAYRFNQWGLRSLTYLQQAIADMQQSEAADIAAMDAWATGPAAPDVLDLEIRSAMYDFVMEGGDLSRATVIRVRDTIASVRTDTVSGGATALINRLKNKLASFQTARTNLFAGVAAALRLGQLPTVNFTAAMGIHLNAPDIKWVIIQISRLVCIVANSENCERWKWLEELKKEYKRELKECQPTIPNPT